MRMDVLYYLALAYQVTQKVPFLARIVELVTSLIASSLRCFSGLYVAEGLGKCKRPAKLLVLYEFEGCPFCRKVREAISVLDLDVEIRPCPRETLKAYGVCEKSRFRPEVTKLGGKQMFPFLVDDNTGVKMNESDAIIKYLWETYGSAAAPPMSYRLGLKLQVMPLMALPALFRPLLTHGVLRVPSKAPKEPLELWGYEPSPFVRFVREALCVLELPYVLRTVAGRSPKRKEFREKYGHMLSAARTLASSTLIQVPLLRDPNTGVVMLESADIVKYLYATYQDGPMVQETWLDYSVAGRAQSQGTTGAIKKD